MGEVIDADYVVIGAGAMGLAFADTLVAETDARVAIVDRNHAPGGHWTVAYPFVRLHQPSSGYGVNSRALGDDALDTQGWNAGLLELASVSEVCAYFDAVMQRVLLPTGRVDYHPMSDWDGARGIRSLVTGAVSRIAPGARIVDSTYQDVTVPAMRPPPYAVADGVACVPPNGLARLDGSIARYTVIGAGKTGMDACLWLLRHDVDPDTIRWIMPRDSWLIDRELTQGDARFAEPVLKVLMGTVEAVTAATSIDDLFVRLEACGRLIRLDPAVRPTMYRCATVSRAELVQLRRIRDVVRLGRVQAIEPDRMVLDGGTLPVAPNTLHVDCSADGLPQRAAVPVFAGERITLQSVRTCQQVFSAAMIAHVEAAGGDDAAKNALCHPVAHPNTDADFLRTTIEDVDNEARWAASPTLQDWLYRSRLNWTWRVVGPLPEDAGQRAEALAMQRGAAGAIADKLRELLAQA